MKCPKCKTGDLFFYKEVEKAYHIELNKDNTLSKRHKTSTEMDTVKEFLECKKCGEWFDFELTDNDHIIKGSLCEHW